MFELIFYVVLTAITFVISELIRPKPKIENARPAHLGDFNFPTATEGRIVPLVWGTVKLSGPNVIWYGDLDQVAMRKKVKTGMFSSAKQTTGYKYYVGIQMGLCRGVVDELQTIWIGDKIVWTGRVGESVVQIDQPNLFGGDKLGQGGVQGDFRFYRGTAAQTANAYLSQDPPDFLWFDDYSDGSDNNPFYAYGGRGDEGTDPNLWYRVSNKGQVGGPGPGSSLASATDDVTMSTLQNVPILETGSGAIKVRSAFKSFSGAPGNLNNYAALLTHPDRPRMSDNIKMVIQFKKAPHGGTFGSDDIWMGCKCKDTGDMSSNYGIYARVGQDNVTISYESPTTGGLHDITTLYAPSAFPGLSDDLHSLELQVVGVNVKCLLDGIIIYDDDLPLLADIDPNDNQGFVVGVGAQLNNEFFSANDWSDNGIYTLGIDSLLRSHSADVPAYRGTSYGVFEHGYIGNTTQIQPWAFQVRRCPNGLSLTSNKHLVNGVDANPMNVIYEILTDPDWGLGFQSSDIDLTNFRAVASTLFDEGNGFSMVIDSALECNELLKEVQRQIDGSLSLNRTSGKWQVKLARADYTLMDLPSLDEANVLEVTEFTRGSWEETSNVVRTEFANRDNNYGTTYANAQDQANIILQAGTIVAVTSKYPGVKNRTLANQLAWRDLRTLAYPLAKATLVVDRTMHALNPGDIIKWSDASLKDHNDNPINNMPCRVTRIDLGRLDQGQITLNILQDVFTYDLPSFADPTNTNWLIPTEVVASNIGETDRKIFEAPRALCMRTEDSAGTFDRIWIGARYPLDRSSRFDVWAREGTNDYGLSGSVEHYLLVGELTSNLDMTATQGSVSVEMDGTPDSTTSIQGAVDNASSAEIGVELANVFMIGDEFFAFKTWADTGTTTTLSGGYRGLLDTVPASYPAGTKVWLLCVGGNLTDVSFSRGATVDVKPVPENRNGSLLLGLASNSQVTLTDRALKPYPPANLAVNGVVQEDSASLDDIDATQLSTYWALTDTALTSDYNHGIDVTVGQTFKPQANGYVHGMRFYKGSANNSGTHVGHLYDNSNTTLASVTFSGEIGTGWQTAFFASPVAVTSGTQYKIGYYAPNGHTALGTGLFAAPSTHGNIQVTGGAAHTGNSAPSFGDTNAYYVDPIFAVAGSLLDYRGLILSFTRRDFRNMDEVKAVVSEANLPSDFPTANTTEYRTLLINDPAGTPATVKTITYSSGNSNFVSRNKILRQVAAIPSSMRATVATHHTYDGVVYDAAQTLVWDFAVTSALLTGDQNWGVLPYNTAPVTAYTAVATGTFTLNIGHTLTGNVEVQLNGGAWTSVITAASYTGTFAVTSGDTIKVRHLQNTTTPAETLVELVNPSGTSVAFAIFTY